METLKKFEEFLRKIDPAGVKVVGPGYGDLNIWVADLHALIALGSLLESAYTDEMLVVPHTISTVPTGFIVSWKAIDLEDAKDED